MTLETFISSASFAAILTAFVTIASCIISYVQGIKKIKTDNFGEVYNCLHKLSKLKEENINHCSRMIARLTASMPEDISPSSVDSASYRSIYHEFHVFLAKYSAYLESLMSFYHFLYKDKPNIPATKEECWEILRQYADFTEVTSSIVQDCKLEYLQIITLIQFIKTNSGIIGRAEIYRYFKSNGVFQNRRSRVAKAFF